MGEDETREALAGEEDAQMDLEHEDHHHLRLGVGVIALGALFVILALYLQMTKNNLNTMGDAARDGIERAANLPANQ